ncbi:MAG: hypothetical protein GWO41_00375 [candidate division Zixibacteria bacterium]|nr:hypothetical protein [candidate division Zixibacteria bacterium]NIR65161.1 hypothetical protein [candidate division Zixibacteria bacterium]NIS14711.1 hypothetical protein [candidate division Zixibacteria bacterium]NIS46895.1 hypothetical protein [candidate division Zixibacteria bacterium]NIT51239.1 hypothetical protein [candidate division Zixibacteria bacterium]
MKIVMSIVFLLLLFNIASAQEYPETYDPFEVALEAVGLSKETLRFDYGDMSNYGGDKFALPLFYTLHSSPFKVELYSRLFRDNLLKNCASALALTAFSSQRINKGIRRGLISSPLDRVKPLLESETPLHDAIVKFEAFYTIPMDQDRRNELKEEAAQVPLELQKMAALIIFTAIDSSKHHYHAFEEVREDYDLRDMREKFVTFIASETDVSDIDMEPFLEEVDFRYLYTPAQDLAMALDFVSESLTVMNFNQEFEFEWQTSAGKVLINDNRKHEYSGEEAYFLIIDVGGDDVYRNAASNIDFRNWISILIDVEGNDTYKSEKESVGSFGAGIFGYGFLVDLMGDDIYSGQYITQGAGLCGVGMLIDYGGRDSYDAYVCGQGSGVFGQGILSDLSGDDRYHMFQLGQGFGFSIGIGILVDSTGNDEYIANDSIIDFPASQSKEHNSNLCQGVGFGKRADFIDGHSWAGGIGMLVDGSGDDFYSAGLFAQGCAYWYAIGLLSDVAGDDIYDGVWYVQGSGAHFGLGILLESGGNDRYTAEMNMAIGAGHDFTLGMFIEESGNDIYNAPNLSLGGGNANGIGIFWDKSGDDSYYVTAATTLGRANVASRGSLRDYIMCLGLFLDTGGNDLYPEEYDFARNNTLWTQPGTNTEEPLPKIELGVGYDTE